MFGFLLHLGESVNVRADGVFIVELVQRQYVGGMFTPRRAQLQEGCDGHIMHIKVMHSRHFIKTN